jgi:hypothetical protein
MKMKEISLGELSQILKEQFRLTGSQIGESMSVPGCLKPLARGREAVVSLRLHRGGLVLAGYDEIYAVRAENQQLKKKLKDAEIENKSLNALIEEQSKKQEESMVVLEHEGEESVYVDKIPVKPPKKKKKSRKKEVKTSK